MDGIVNYVINAGVRYFVSRLENITNTCHVCPPMVAQLCYSGRRLSRFILSTILLPSRDGEEGDSTLEWESMPAET